MERRRQESPGETIPRGKRTESTLINDIVHEHRPTLTWVDGRIVLTVVAPMPLYMCGSQLSPFTGANKPSTGNITRFNGLIIYSAL